MNGVARNYVALVVTRVYIHDVRGLGVPVAECSATDSNCFVLCWVWLLSYRAAFATLLLARDLDFKALRLSSPQSPHWHWCSSRSPAPVPDPLTLGLLGSFLAIRPSMTHIYNLRPWEAEAGKWRTRCQPGLWRETLSQKNNTKATI